MSILNWLKGAAGSQQPVNTSQTDPLPVSVHAAGYSRSDGVSNGYQGLVNAINGLAVFQDSAPLLFNGATWDRERNNAEGTILSSAARTATNQSSDQTNYNARGVRVFINTTTIGAAPSTVFSIQFRDPTAGDYVTILSSVAVVAVGKIILTIYPGMTPAANLALSEPLPRIWRINAAHGNANSHTYSVGFAYIL